MTTTILLASLLVLAACTTSALPISKNDSTAGKLASPPAAASDGLGQGRTEVPHGNQKMDGPPGY